MQGHDFQTSRVLSVRPDGRRLRVLASGLYAVWSPTGRQIVVTRVLRRRPSLQTGLFLISADGTHVRRLTHSPLADYWPTWTAEGRHVVFSCELRANRGYLFYAPADLWKVDVRTGEERRLTALARGGSVAFLPAPGPAGGIVFSLIRAPIRHDPSKPGADLYLRTRRGLLKRLVAGRASESVGPNALSPDRRRLLFFRRGQGIFTLDLASRRVERLTRGRGDGAPGWSPDGRRVTFTRGTGVYVMNADGTGVARIVSGAGSGSWNARC